MEEPSPESSPGSGKKINSEKMQFLVLQGIGYIFLALALFIWARNSKGFLKYINILTGILFIIWGIFDLFYVIYLLNHNPLKYDNYELLGTHIIDINMN